MKIRLPLSAKFVCSTVGHVKRVMYDPATGGDVRVLCLVCGEVWPLRTVKEALHRDRQDMGADCTTLGMCSTDGHTSEWPCDFC